MAVIRLLADDAVAYGGYSAGICVLAPTLRGLEGVDNPAFLRTLYGAARCIEAVDRPFSDPWPQWMPDPAWSRPVLPERWDDPAP